MVLQSFNMQMEQGITLKLNVNHWTFKALWLYLDAFKDFVNTIVNQIDQ